MEEDLPKGAPAIMQQRGISTDHVVMQRILEKPGSTVHEIARDLGWTNGRVDGSANRLLKEGKIRVQHCVRRGMLVKKMYPAEEKIRDPNVLEIPKEMIDEDLWKDTVRVYALSRSSIAISATKIEEWEKRAFWKGDIRTEDGGKEITVKLPGHLSDFYRLENSETSLSTSDDFVLVTVESTIIPVEVPGTFSVQPVSTARFLLLVAGEVKGVPTEVIEPDVYGEYLEDEQRAISMSGLSQVITSVLRSSRKKRMKSSDTTQPAETLVEAVISR
jgi:hypothetical protein